MLFPKKGKVVIRMPQGTVRKLTGPELVDVFLRELVVRVRIAPNGRLDGSPKEIVEEVVRNTDRFRSCNDGYIENLTKQIAQAVSRKGSVLQLRYELLDRGLIRIAIA